MSAADAISRRDPGLVVARRKRTYNVRRIKATWPYTVQEIAELFRIHKNAVLRWLKDGLQANKDQRPFLIRGEELIRFLNARLAPILEVNQKLAFHAVVFRVGSGHVQLTFSSHCLDWQQCGPLCVPPSVAER
jgi:hypothetical protein